MSIKKTLSKVISASVLTFAVILPVSANNEFSNELMHPQEGVSVAMGLANSQSALITGFARNPSLRDELVISAFLGQTAVLLYGFYGPNSNLTQCATATGKINAAAISGIARNPSLKGQIHLFEAYGIALVGLVCAIGHQKTHAEIEAEVEELQAQLLEDLGIRS